MFIQTEAMSDSARLKFLPGREVLAEGALDLRDRAEAVASPLAELLFAIPGVAGVAFVRDAIIVSKSAGEWRHLKPAILGAIMEHFMSGAPVLREQAASGVRAPTAAQSPERLAGIREALRRVIDPELGCNIIDLGLVYDVAVEEDGGVRVTMTTTTRGCPATSYLKQGAREAVLSMPDVVSADVILTYEPSWSPQMMAPAAKAHFGIEDGGDW
jgi:metal-sulfur cluster biosynthetic enzyme